MALLQILTHTLYVCQQLHASAGLLILLYWHLVSQMAINILNSHDHSLLQVLYSL